jgi:NADPH-dependent 2,4-dienoyl-CoA reductase/sulfur reductase-like enzyme
MLQHSTASSWTVVICAALVVTSVEYRAQSNPSPAIASRADVVVFGATPAGVTGAVSAARTGRRVVLIEPGRWVGGMMSGGLSNADTGQRGSEVISGLAGVQAVSYAALRSRLMKVVLRVE